MELEARSCRAPEKRKKVLDRVKAYQAALKDLQAEFTAAKQQVEREMLFGTSGNGSALDEAEDAYAADDRARLLAANDSLGRQSDSVKRSMAMLAETEMVGMEISKELGRNRETIENAHMRVKEVDMMVSARGCAGLRAWERKCRVGMCLARSAARSTYRTCGTPATRAYTCDRCFISPRAHCAYMRASMRRAAGTSHVHPPPRRRAQRGERYGT